MYLPAEEETELEKERNNKMGKKPNKKMGVGDNEGKGENKHFWQKDIKDSHIRYERGKTAMLHILSGTDRL